MARRLKLFGRALRPNSLGPLRKSPEGRSSRSERKIRVRMQRPSSSIEAPLRAKLTRRFGDNDPSKIPDALFWLSRGLEKAWLWRRTRAGPIRFIRLARGRCSIGWRLPQYDRQA